MDGDELGEKAAEQGGPQGAQAERGQAGQAAAQAAQGPGQVGGEGGIGGAGGDAGSATATAAATDYEAALAAKDAKIAELSAQVAAAAKSQEAAGELSGQIEALKAQIADERLDFALKSAGAHDTRAARALWDDYEGTDEERISAMAEACPWLFSSQKPSSRASSRFTSRIHNISTDGATGLESAGVAGGGDGRDVARWEKIAGLSRDSE